MIAIENIRSGESYPRTGNKVPLTYEVKIFRHPKFEKLIHVVVVKFLVKNDEIIKMRVCGSESFDHHTSQMLTIFKGISMTSITNRINRFSELPDNEILIQEANKFKTDVINKPQTLMHF